MGRHYRDSNRRSDIPVQRCISNKPSCAAAHRLISPVHRVFHIYAYVHNILLFAVTAMPSMLLVVLAAVNEDNASDTLGVVFILTADAKCRCRYACK